MGVTNERGGDERVQGGGRANEREASAGGTSECGDGKNECEQGVQRGDDHAWGGGCKRARGECGGYERAQGYKHSNDGSGNGGSGDTMWPPSPSSLSPFYYLFY